MNIYSPSLALGFLLFGLSALSEANEVKGVDVLWEGTYRSSFTKPPEGEPVPKIPLLGAGWVGPRPLRQTDEIPGVKGTQFGVLFVPRAEQGGVKFVKLRYVTRFPEPGLVQAGSAKPVMFVESTIDCITDLACTALYNFDVDSEIIPGDWRIEVYSNEIKLVDKTFKVNANTGK